MKTDDGPGERDFDILFVPALLRQRRARRRLARFLFTSRTR